MSAASAAASAVARGKSAAASLAQRRAGALLEAQKAGAPASVASIPTDGLNFGDANVGIRQLGATRRVFLRQPYMTPDEIEGLAFRLGVLSKNQSMNSILIAANDEEDNPTCFPQFVRDSEREDTGMDFIDTNISSDRIWHVAGAYDPLDVYKSKMYEDSNAVLTLLTNVQKLALAVRGDAQNSKIPVVTLPHGLVNDGGYALCMGSYVMATRDTSFRVMNPSKGLSLDPIGLSYILPRLGWEYHQPSAEYPGIGYIMALTGMEANVFDMMETGLATHYIESPRKLGIMEQALADIDPWKRQGLLPGDKRLMGEPKPKGDKNAAFRNKMVANTLHAFAEYHVSGRDIWSDQHGNYEMSKEEKATDDPSLNLDPITWEQVRESDLVNYGATFDAIFKEESSIQGIMERFRQIAGRTTSDEEEQEGIDVAADIVQRMERQSPLSLSIVYRLLRMGQKRGESLESCMEREKRVQAKLFGMADYQNWAKHTLQSNIGDNNDDDGDDAPLFQNWKHTSVKDVTVDEVDEI
eukprot:CAMPEP_0195299878 /NCGR_PEP_ID=MMETSP0707-20130614/26354_1 /TAXON_ID=33640 /ORGANISM="Asterionellopsis glacialis, Strain CCMP134" /LENGTH=524 /DNA_ID=CAMNT_0040362397 /DNA_START=60 /DNA_END=1631 /DNA_ORIENTATION=-